MNVDSINHCWFNQSMLNQSMLIQSIIVAINQCWFNQSMLIRSINVDSINQCWFNQSMLIQSINFDSINQCWFNHSMLIQSLNVDSIHHCCNQSMLIQTINQRALQFSWVKPFTCHSVRYPPPSPKREAPISNEMGCLQGRLHTYVPQAGGTHIKWDGLDPGPGCCQRWFVAVSFMFVRDQKYTVRVVISPRRVIVAQLGLR